MNQQELVKKSFHVRQFGASLAPGDRHRWWLWIHLWRSISRWDPSTIEVQAKRFKQPMNPWLFVIFCDQIWSDLKVNSDGSWLLFDFWFGTCIYLRDIQAQTRRVNHFLGFAERYRGMMGVASAGRGTKTNGSSLCAFFVLSVMLCWQTLPTFRVLILESSSTDFPKGALHRFAVFCR
jgi:hypothetical protein